MCGESMRDSAFIFTMDAVLALIPLFIILGGVTQFSDVQSLYAQSYILGSERIAQDVLESMRIHGDFDVLSESTLNETITAILPQDYEYDYQVKFGGSVLVSVNSSTPPAHANILAAKRTAFINIEKILDQVISLTHGGDPGTDPYCDCNNTNKVWQMNFSYAPGSYDYYIRGERNETGTRVFWSLRNDQVPTSECKGGGGANLCSLSSGDGQQIFNAGTGYEYTFKLNNATNVKADLPLADSVNYVYVRVEGNPSKYVDVFVIRAPTGTDESRITSENARRYDNAEVTLRIWRE